MKAAGKKDWTREINVMKGSQVTLHERSASHSEANHLPRQSGIKPGLAQIVIELRHPQNFQ